MALRLIIVYSFILSLALLGLYWFNINQIDRKTLIELENELSSMIKTHNQSGLKFLINYINESQHQEEKIYLLISEEGEKISGNLLNWPEDFEIESNHKAKGIWINDEVIPVEIYDDDAYWPVVSANLNDGNRLLLARKIEQAETLQFISEFLIDAIGMSIIFASLISILLGRKILRKMDIISATASNIMSGDLSQRIPISKHNDEFNTLSKNLNSMLERIQQLIKGIREVTDNIAHDLRSPLTRLRSKIEVTLLEPRSEEEYREVLRESVEDIESLIKTFNALLSIAQAEAGNHRMLWQPVNLKKLALDLMDLYMPLVENKHQSLTLQNGVDPVILGSRDLLAQSFGNLLENAIKYTPEGGSIIFKVEDTSNDIIISVSDTGPGIPENEHEHVLEKFYRLDSSRHTEGNGLGLSLVKAVASLHKASLKIKNTNPGVIISHRFTKA